MAITGDNKTIQISVIIPTYNRAWCLNKAIDSVLSQTSASFELIVVDDGSTDHTQALLTEYAGRLINLKQSNQGVSAARNAGIEYAQGALIAFLDSDDEWLPGKLAVQSAFFNSHPNAVACQTEEIWVRNGVRVNPKKKHAKPSGDIFKRSLSLCLVSPSAVMLKKSLFDEVGYFDESLPACEDYDMWLRISCRYPVQRLNAPLIVKNGGHNDQLSRQAGLDRYRIQSLLKLIKSGLLSKGQKIEAAAVLSEKCRIYALGCRKRGRATEAEYYDRLIIPKAGEAT